MKSIDIVCFDDSRASLTTSDLHISDEHDASVVTIDFEQIEEEGVLLHKWCDVVLSDGTSLRYELGDESVVSFELSSALTVPGLVVFTPFVVSESGMKMKFVPDSSVVIKRQIEAGDPEAKERDDYIFALAGRVTILESEDIDGGEFEILLEEE